MLFTSSWKVDIFLFLATIAYLLYKYSTRNFNYWSKRHVYHPKPVAFFGNFVDISLFKTTIGEWLKTLYDGTDDPYFGIFVFGRPKLVLKNPELIKNVLVRDFKNFMDRTVATPKHDEIISNLMFLQKSPEWKMTRAQITPVFTSLKMKAMFPLMNQTGEKLNHYIGKHLGDMEAKEVCSKYSTEVIAKCAFGINAHCFDKDDAVFRQIARSVFDFTWRNAVSQITYFFCENWVNLFRIYLFPKWTMDYLSETFIHIMKKRENSDVRANDLIDILNDLKKNKEFCEDMHFEGNRVVSQAIQFFVAGFETTGSAISFTLYELGMNQHIQDKVRCEILNNIKKYDGITYEGVNDMKYLEMCINETLRKYPFLPFLDRLCNEDYKLPGTDLVVEKGMHVYIPMFGLHYDEKYFPNPHKYIPERFTKENHNKYGLVYLPFGSGPRNCIGSRFGMIATKIGLIHIISQFQVEQTDATPNPIEFEPKSFVLQSKVGIPLRFKTFVPSSA